MNKTYPIVIIAVLTGAAGFFGGMQYQKSRQSFVSRNVGEQGFSQEQRDQMRQQFGGAGGFQGGRNGATRTNGSVASGEIIAKDDNSITVKLSDGGPASPDGVQDGSKIVFYSPTTEVGKFDQGSVDDLSVGKSVLVSGTANSDGSLTAHNIQLRSSSLSVPERR